MDVIGYTFYEEELNEITKKLQDFKNALLLDLVVLMDDGGRLISYAPYTDTHKPLANRVAVIGAAVVGAVDQLENIISSKRNMFFCRHRKKTIRANGKPEVYPFLCVLSQGSPGERKAHEGKAFG